METTEGKKSSPRLSLENDSVHFGSVGEACIFDRFDIVKSAHGS